MASKTTATATSDSATATPASRRTCSTKIIAIAVASAALICSLIALSTILIVDEIRSDKGNKDLGEVTYKADTGELWGPGVENGLDLINSIGKSTAANTTAVVAHEKVTITVVQVQYVVVGRALKEAGLSVEAEIDVEERLRPEVPPGANTIEGGESTYATALVQNDGSADWAALDLECDGTRCVAHRDGRRKLGRTEAEEVARWVCKLTCKAVTTLVEHVMVTWACEPVASFLCDTVLGAEGNMTLWTNDSSTVHGTCKKAVFDTCSGKYPLETARQALRTSLLSAFGVDETAHAAMPDALELILVQWAKLEPSGVYAALESDWVQKVENVCADWCTKIVVTIYTWVSTCFPAHAMVNVLPAPGTEAVATPISAASVGDLVETPHGFEPIYFQGHASTAANQYIRVTLDSNHTLELSPDHYLPIHTASAPGRVEHMLAKDAEAGMALRLANDAADGGVAAISKVERVVLLGAYNPYTPSGELIVNGVVASCHSSWFLEGGYVSPSLVPSVYQALLAPLRALYSAAPVVVKRFADHFATANDNRPMSELKLGEIMRALAAPLATTAKAA